MRSGILIPLTFVLLLVACSPSTHYLTIRSDRSAHVRSLYIDDHPKVKMFRETPSFYSNKNIKNLVVKDSSVADYDILELDSLGNFINAMLARNFFHFDLNHDTLNVQAGPGEMLNPKFNDWTKGDYIHLKFDRKVNRVLINGKDTKFKDNQVVFVAKKKYLRKNKLEVQIIFEN